MSVTFTWTGKEEAYAEAVTPLDADIAHNNTDSDNLFFEMDNIHALKWLLSNGYKERVKMIYIDPPYNTGNKMHYKDKFRHHEWLNMMYPRLVLARELLKEDGVIFISIDDHEHARLKLLCDEVFGEGNFVGNIVWEKRYGRSNNAKLMTAVTEHVLLYRKSCSVSILRERRSVEIPKGYSNPDDDPRGIWTSVSFINQATREQRPNLSYTVTNPNTGEKIDHPTNAWKVSEKKYNALAREGRLHWGADGRAKYPRIKRFLQELDVGMTPTNFWSIKKAGTVDVGTQEVGDAVGHGVFSFPKPTLLVKQMLALFSPVDLPEHVQNDSLGVVINDDIILDFFAGSGTTAHAVMQLNAEDGGNRKWICVQIPEPCKEDSEAYKAGYKTIAGICKERIRRAGQKIKEKHPDVDISFKEYLNAF